MPGLMRRRGLAVCALIAGLVLGGCTARQTVRTPPMKAPTPSQSHLSTPVPSGWLRTVGRSDGLVLVFECQQVAVHDKGLRYRFIVFNESPQRRSWDDALFVVNSKKAGGYEDPDPNDNWVPTGLGVTAGDYPIGYFGNYDFLGLVLRSGESTTHAGELSGREGSGKEPYLSMLTPSFKGGDRDRAEVLVSAPHVIVRLE